jgi:hypothetical protein
MTLNNFVKKINDIARNECEKLNQEYEEGKSPFGASYIELPVDLLKHYYNQGYTPEKTLQMIEDEAIAEAYAESMAS